MGSPVSSPGEYKLFAEARAKQSGALRRGAKRENPWRDCAARGVPQDSGQQTTERITIGARRKPIKLLSGSMTRMATGGLPATKFGATSTSLHASIAWISTATGSQL